MNKKVVYIAGPISGVENYWEPFEAAEAELAAHGFVVLTPTKLPPEIDNGRAMKICLSMIDQADAVLFLHGWNLSIGANLELYYCKYTNKPYAMSVGEVRGLLK